LQCHSDEEKSGPRYLEKRAPGRRDTETESEKGVGSDPHASKRTTTRLQASWLSEKRSPSREAPERQPWPARQAKHRLLSKGAAERGAAEETPNLSRQRVGDKGCSTGNEEGHSRTHENAPRVLHSSPSTPKGSCGQHRWQSEVYASDRIFPARRGNVGSSESSIRQRKRTTSPARGATIRCGRGYWRSRVCPYVESSLQKSVSGNGPKKRRFPTF